MRFVLDKRHQLYVNKDQEVNKETVSDWISDEKLSQSIKHNLFDLYLERFSFSQAIFWDQETLFGTTTEELLMTNDAFVRYTTKFLKIIDNSSTST